MTIVSDCGREIVVTKCDLGVEVSDNHEFFNLALDYIKNSYHLTLDDPWFSVVDYKLLYKYTLKL